jgi:hypothetical protein
LILYFYSLEGTCIQNIIFKLFMTLMQVAKMLKVNKRIGLATTEDGSYIYVCPEHKGIITVLAKYGFWKGASTINTSQDSLIGFVVWD